MWNGSNGASGGGPSTPGGGGGNDAAERLAASALAAYVSGVPTGAYPSTAATSAAQQAAALLAASTGTTTGATAASSAAAVADNAILQAQQQAMLYGAAAARNPYGAAAAVAANATSLGGLHHAAAHQQSIQQQLLQQQQQFYAEQQQVAAVHQRQQEIAAAAHQQQQQQQIKQQLEIERKMSIDSQQQQQLQQQRDSPTSSYDEEEQQQQQQQQQQAATASSSSSSSKPRGKPEAMATALAEARMKRAQEEEEKKKKHDGGIDNMLTSPDHDVKPFTPQQHNKNKSKNKKKTSSSSTAGGGEASTKTSSKSATSSTSKKKKSSSTSSGTKKSSSSSSSPGSASINKNVPTMDDPIPSMTENEYGNLVKLMEQFCKVPLLAEFSRPVSLLHPELMPVYNKIIKKYQAMDLSKVCRRIRRRQYKNTRQVKLDMWRIFSNCIKYHTSPINKDNSVPSFVSISLHLREYFNALWQEYMLPSEEEVLVQPPSTTSSSSTGGNTITSPSSAFVKQRQKEFKRRNEDRIKRRKAVSATYLSPKCLQKTATEIQTFLETGGCVDKMDSQPIFNVDESDSDSEEEDEEYTNDLDTLIESLQEFQKDILKKAQTNDDYNVDQFVSDYQSTHSNLENMFTTKPPSFRIKLKQRLDRLLAKIICPIYEANGRGVNQSSIWGCMAATVWARESSKKPFWPAVVLGILAPDDQKEDWHFALTARNESRLPEKLRQELQPAKRKADLALKRQTQNSADQMSFFLVEFMGTHEFIWVKENDIIENFDPDNDPNVASAAGNVTKKKRSSRPGSHNVVGSKVYTTGIQEARWALDEFEMQLQDTCGDMQDDDEDDEEEVDPGIEQDMNYSFTVLCQSDDEADDEEKEQKEQQKRESGGDGGSEQATLKKHADDEDVTMTMSDIEEANELLATEGLLDFTVAGRKNAKKRVAARKKLQASAEKAALKKQGKGKSKAGGTRKVSGKTKGKKVSNGSMKPEDELKEIEKKRKQRTKERERVLKDELRKKNKIRKMSDKIKSMSPDDIDDNIDIDDLTSGDGHGGPGSRIIANKRGRANAIVKGYLTRYFEDQIAKDNFKNIGGGFSGTIPVSVVDLSGLLGMALAFRAAAGEIDVPCGANEDSDFNKSNKHLCPEDQIDLDTIPASAERCKILSKKKEFLQNEVTRIKEEIERRKLLTEEALKQKKNAFNLIVQREKIARKSNMKKRKKYGKQAQAAAAREQQNKKAKKNSGDNENNSKQALKGEKEKPVSATADEEKVQEKMDEDDDTHTSAKKIDTGIGDENTKDGGDTGNNDATDELQQSMATNDDDADEGEDSVTTGKHDDDEDTHQGSHADITVDGNDEEDDDDDDEEDEDVEEELNEGDSHVHDDEVEEDDVESTGITDAAAEEDDDVE